MDNNTHVPVLLAEVLQLLQPQAHGRYLDGTVGAGGHSQGILEASAPSGRVLAFDRDPNAIAFTRRRLASFSGRITFVNASFAEMGQLAPAHGFEQIDGILLDLGLSSRQLADDKRGFSFMKDGPLDMRFDPTQGPTAADLVNELSEAELADIIWRYGEEKQSRKVSRAIVANRPIRTSGQLAAVVAGQIKQRRRIHPATKTFQALRIATNRELEALEQGLSAALTLLKPGGRLAVISFHSLEDRMVKHRFRELSRDCICPPEQIVCTCDAAAAVRLITRKPIKASNAEIEANPRSRSARLRVVEKIGT
ncbi:MAG: 16S rRNA (cytosine(1402)-N(4))-methyltransferase RsmH [Anaerolineae bacterium]